MTACVDCGHENPPSESHCQACNGNLQAALQAATGMWIDRLQEATDGHLHGQLSAEQLRTHLLTLEETLAARAREVVETIEGNDYQLEHEAEVNAGIAGIQAVEQGLAEVWQYQEDGDRERLAAGLAEARRGLEMIREAMRLNREAKATLAEEWVTNQADFEHQQSNDWLEVA